MATGFYTPAMQRHADALLKRSKFWTRAVRKSDGLALVIFPSSRGTTSYYSAESGCTCPGYLWRGRCAHQLAISREAEVAREAAIRKPLVRYEDVYPEQCVSAF